MDCNYGVDYIATWVENLEHMYTYTAIQTVQWYHSVLKLQ